ncbi:MAG: hypothetical protein H6734_14120 [Alphaproteobacteria bacterium]|nr:hypothetical protein [Alphaproteobacteria bacterium]
MAQRDWDLTSPVRDPLPIPSLTHGCWFGGTFLGVDATPGLQHTYRSLSGRGPMTFTTSFGVPLVRRGGFRLATWLVVNRSAMGGGLMVSQAWEDRRILIRVGAVPGPAPTVLASVQVAPGRTRPLGSDPAVSTGFEVGGMSGLRLERALSDPRAGIATSLGLRVAALHRPRHEVYFRPTVLATLVLYAHFYDEDDDSTSALALLQLSAGTVIADGVPRPAYGIAVPLGGRTAGLFLGVLFTHDDTGPRAFTDGGAQISF